MSVRRQQRAYIHHMRRLFSLKGFTHGLTGHHVRLLMRFSLTIATRNFVTMEREAIDMHDTRLYRRKLVQLDLTGPAYAANACIAQAQRGVQTILATPDGQEHLARLDWKSGTVGRSFRIAINGATEGNSLLEALVLSGRVSRLLPVITIPNHGVRKVLLGRHYFSMDDDGGSFAFSRHRAAWTSKRSAPMA